MASINDTIPAGDENEFFHAVTSSFLDWVWAEVLPKLLLTLFLVFFVIGITINVTLLYVAAKNSWLKEPIHAFIIQLCFIDILACAFVVLPTLISVEKGSSAFPETDSSCRFQHTIFNACQISTNFFILVSVIERTTRIANSQLYLKSFGNVCFVYLTVVSIWVFSFAVSALSTVNQELEYDGALYHCLVDYTKNPGLMAFMFFITFYLPSIIIALCFVIIFYLRNRRFINELFSIENQTANQPIQDFTDMRLPNKYNDESNKATSVFIIDSPNGQRCERHNVRATRNQKDNTNHKDFKIIANPYLSKNSKIGLIKHHSNDTNTKANQDETDLCSVVTSHARSQNSPQIGESLSIAKSRENDISTSQNKEHLNAAQLIVDEDSAKTKRKPKANSKWKLSLKIRRKFSNQTKWKRVVERVQTRSKFAQVFHDHPDDVDQHQSMTYLITWLVVSVCWLTYIVSMNMAVYYTNRCSPCLSVAVLMGQFTYSCKPLVYIGHNRWYRDAFTATVQMVCRKR